MMRRSRLLALILGLAAVVALAIVGTLLIVGAVQRAAALDAHATVARELSDAAEAARASADDVDELLAVADDPLLPPVPLASLDDARSELASTLDESAALLSTSPDTLDTDGIRTETARMRDVTAALGSDDGALDTALEELVVATRDASGAVEAANFDAENRAHLDFRAAATALDPGAAASVGAYLEAAHALEASHAEEIAEKSGPLLERRLAVEAFARSIAGGVLLDFDWAATVNGYGSGGSYGGTSYWQSAEGGYATITLSDSVATLWPAAGPQSLVAHEVGHAILSTCTSLFFGTEYESAGEEAWATAWAIGMGYTADGNGESIYGHPTDGLIQLSTQCR